MVLVLGGTSDSIKICELINKKGFCNRYILSVTTEYGKDLADGIAKKIHLGKMSEEDMDKFIMENKVSFIIDATHPYATEVSKNAIKAAETTDTGYIRYERKSLLEEIDYKGCRFADSIDEMCEMAKNNGYKRILIGTGSKNLAKYRENLPEIELFPRVLPTSEVIIECEKLGFNADNIIAMKGPFSKDMNVEMIKHYDIDLMLTKESGAAGGFLEKIDACEECGIDVIVLKRQRMDYPNQTSDLKDIENILDIWKDEAKFDC